MRIFLIAFQIGLAALFGSANAQDQKGGETQLPFRKWTSSKGTQLIAQLGPMESQNQVTLISKDGRTLNIKINTLSEKDQNYVRRLWYSKNPIYFIGSVKPVIFNTSGFFFNEIQAKIDSSFVQLVYPAWETVTNISIKKFDTTIKKLSPEGTPTVHLLDRSWRLLLTGKNKSSLLASKIRLIRKESATNIKLLLVDHPLHDNKLPTVGREFITNHQDVKKGIEQVEEFLKRKDLGPNVIMVSIRRLKQRIELLCPEWKIEDRELGYLTEAAIATITTHSVPTLLDIQKAIVAERKREHEGFIAKENSFLSLSSESLLKIETVLREQITKNR